MKEIERQVREIEDDPPTALILPESIQIERSLKSPKRSRGRGTKDDSSSQADTDRIALPVRCIYLPAESDRSTLKHGRHAAKDELLKVIEDVIRYGASPSSEERAKLPQAVEKIMQAARDALGMGAKRDRKKIWRMLWPRMDRSARATIAPLGPDCQGLDDIVLPQPIWMKLFPGVPGEERRWIWLKRDPILHRWGLVRVRARRDADEKSVVIRLPASLLGPMHADFDGDTAAVYAEIPGIDADKLDRDLVRLAWDDWGNRPMYLPGKQYRYGLYLLLQDSNRLEVFLRGLEAARAPVPDVFRHSLNSPKDVRLRLDALIGEWSKAAAPDPDIRASWWALLESHALAALATDPGMGLAFFGSWENCNKQAVVCCGAARIPDAARHALKGRVIKQFESGDPRWDPIETMIESETSKGRFGSAAQKLIHRAPHVDSDFVRMVQYATEQMQQRALDSKSGRPLSSDDFRTMLGRVLRDQFEDWYKASSTEGGSEQEPVGAYLTSDKCQKDAWLRISKAMATSNGEFVWEWMSRPGRLFERIAKEKEGVRIALHDPRAAPWIESDGRGRP